MIRKSSKRTQTVEQAVEFANEIVRPQQPLLPKFGYTQLLVLLLIAASFLIGQFYTQIQELKSSTTAVAGAQVQNPAVTPTPGKVNVGLGNYQIQGKSDAKVKIVAFEDDRCPFCQQFMENTMPQIIKDYVDTGKAQVSFRDYAFLGASSTLAANANGCANEQGKFWDWINYMFKNQPSETDTSMYTNDNLASIAGQLGMDTTQFSNCMTSNKYAKQAAQDLADGQKVGVSGTPTIFVNGTPLVGAQPYTAFQTIIDQELAKK